jgi:hypothetical protein
MVIRWKGRLLFFALDYHAKQGNASGFPYFRISVEDFPEPADDVVSSMQRRPLLLRKPVKESHP